MDNQAFSGAKRLACFVALTLSLNLLQGCTTTPTHVQYGDSKAVETVTDQFGSTDLQMMAESMTRSMLQSPVIIHGNRPLLTVAEVKNRTSEYIDTRSITDSIRTQLSKSGAVRFAVAVADMDNQTEELIRQNQSGLYKKSTTKKMGKMEGSDYRMEGNISSIVKRTSDVHDVYYKFNLRLVNIESGILEWEDEKEIRKTATR